MNYHELLGLAREPFGNSPDPDFFHGSPRHAECLRRLEIAVRLRRGLSVVVGEVGTGKSTVCRRLIRTLSYDPDVLVHLLLDPSFADPRDFLAAVAVSFGILVDGEDSASRIREAIQEYLLQKGQAEGKVVVLCVDEGQKISAECLEILRELLNFETNAHKLLQIVVFAQPEFSAMLAARKNLADRVNSRFDLKPLSLPETKRLIRTRLRLAAADILTDREPKLFTEAALRAIHRATGGYPRRIMRLCHAALLETVGREKTRVGVSEVRAARDTNDRDPGLSWRAALVAAIPVVAVLFMVLGPGRERAARLLDQGLLEMGGAVSGFPDNVPGYDDLRQTLAEGGVSLRAWVDRSLREQPTASGGTVDQAAESEVPSPAASVAVEADGAAEPVAMVLAEPTPEVAVTPLSEPIPTAAAPAVATTPRAEPAVSEAMPAGSSPAVESVPAGPEAIPAPPAPAVLAEAPAPPPAVSETERPALSPFGQDVEEVVIQVEHHGPEPAVENAAAPVVIPALAPVQAATVLPDASDPPAAPASRILAATPPRTLGQMVMRPGWSLSKAAARLYGHASKRVMSDLARANPDIPDLNLVRPGDLVIFPVRVASPPPAGAQVVRLERLSGLDEAFSALSRVRERVQDTALFACFSPEAGLTFDVVLDHLYPDAVTAAQALAELPGDLASRAGTMALDDPLAIYYSSLVSPGGGDGPVAPVKAVAQNAAVPVAGAR